MKFSMNHVFVCISVLFTLMGFPFAAADAGAAPPHPSDNAISNPATTAPRVFRYTKPGYEGGNYGALVLQRGPAFTEAELIRYCDDVAPVAELHPEALLQYMTSKKGWESDRVYYIMAKVSMAESSIRGGTPSASVQGQKDLAPTPQEITLVKKHHARIPAMFGGGRGTGE